LTRWYFNKLNNHVVLHFNIFIEKTSNKCYNTNILLEYGSALLVAVIIQTNQLEKT